MIFNIFKRKYTPWVPAHLFTYNFSTYLIQVRIHKFSGLIQFRTDNVNKKFTQMTDIDNPFNFKNTISNFYRTESIAPGKRFSKEDVEMIREKWARIHGSQQKPSKKFETGGVECGGGGEVELPKDKINNKKTSS